LRPFLKLASAYEIAGISYAVVLEETRERSGETKSLGSDPGRMGIVPSGRPSTPGSARIHVGFTPAPTPGPCPGHRRSECAWPGQAYISRRGGEPVSRTLSQSVVARSTWCLRLC